MATRRTLYGCMKCRFKCDGCIDCNDNKFLAKDMAIAHWAVEHGHTDGQRYDPAVYREILAMIERQEQEDREERRSEKGVCIYVCMYVYM